MIKKIKVAKQPEKDTLFENGKAYINYFEPEEEELKWTERHNDNAGVTIKVSPANVYTNFGLRNFKKGSKEWVQLMRQYFPQDVAEMSEDEIKEFEPTAQQKAQLEQDLAHKKHIDTFKIECYKDGDSANKIYIGALDNVEDIQQVVNALAQAEASTFDVIYDPLTDVDKKDRAKYRRNAILSHVPSIANIFEDYETNQALKRAKRGSTNRVILNENIINRGFDFKKGDIREDFDILGATDGNYTVRIRTYTQRDKKDSVKVKNIATKEEAKAIRDILLSVNSSLNQEKLNAIFKSNSTLRKIEEENPEIEIEEGDSNDPQAEKTISTAMLVEEGETLDSVATAETEVCDADVYSYFVMADEMDDDKLEALEDYELTYEVVRGNYVIKGTSKNLSAYINEVLEQEGTEADLIGSANKEFSRVRTADEESEEAIKEIDKLIADEEEAIKGYEKAMEKASEKNKALYSHIISEELEHIEELKNLRELHTPKTEDSVEVEDAVLNYIVAGVPQRIVKTDADNKYHGLFTPQYKTAEGKLINLGTFETPTKAKKALEFFYECNEDLEWYFDGTNGYALKEGLTEAEKASIFQAAKKYITTTKPTEAEDKGWYEREGGKFVVYSELDGITEEFERYDDENTAKYVAKVINESKNKKEVLEKLKRLDIINKFKNEFGPTEISAKEKYRW